MKIIDLFVKISKDEKVPNRIKSQGLIFEFDEESRQYYEEGRLHSADYSLRSWLYNFKCLNDEIEIIEEPKKIEHCLKRDRFLRDEDEIEHLKTKIDELIDEVNKLKGKIV